MRPLVTVTPNPSVDRTLHVSDLVRGAVLRATDVSVHASGKGVNVSRVLVAHGLQSVAVLPLGGDEGEQLRTLAEADGVAVSGVPIAGRIRSNVSIVEPDGVVTKLNEPGPLLSAAEAGALLEATAAAATGVDWIVGCGSLPPGVPVDFFAQVSGIARRAGARVAVDSSGAPLRATVGAGVDLLKPNAHELAEVTGRPLAALGDAVAAAQEVRAAGTRAVLVSLGADGALLVDGEGAIHGEARVDAPASSVGAGDALLAGFLAAGGQGREALAAGLAWAAATVRRADSSVPRREDVDRSAVELHDRVDAGRPLRDAEPAVAGAPR